MLFNEIIVATVTPFMREGKQADKNGLQNVYLKVAAGKCPNTALFVAGTVANQAGLVVGKTLQIMIDERKLDPQYGRQFGHTVLGEVKPSEILGLRKELGAPLILDTNDGGNAAANILEGEQPAANLDKGATPEKVELQSGLEEVEETEEVIN